jgi:hypothetical protein
MPELYCRFDGVKLALASIALVILTGSAPVLAQQTVGLFLNEDDSFDGYTLFAPMPSQTTYLIDNEGKQVHSWSSGYRPGLSAYLLENGNLLRTAQYDPGGSRFTAGGRGGRVEEHAWDGTLVWEFDYSTAVYRQHHDIEPLPNGNVLLIAWEYKSYDDAVAAGRDPFLLSDDELWPDHVIEVEPTGPSGGTIVWEWHAWDHLIQDMFPAMDNFGVVADHPELLDLNFVGAGGNPGRADWNHVNSIDYNEALDQIVLSSHAFSEIWVIDHSTTTAEAAGHTGGNSGKGGDLLYRWGNPQAYRAGVAGDQQLFRQHDARWNEPGHPGEGNILIFNNGGGRPGGSYTSVDEIVPPVDEFGDYPLTPGSAYGPSQASWSYTADPPSSFYAQNISGAHRLANGNTLVCSGPQGIFFEVTAGMATVWRYVSPITNSGPLTQGDPAVGNNVFRATRYAPDYAGLEGKDLTPGDPLESFTRPTPVPDGSGATAPVTYERLTAAGDQIQVAWDVSSCPADTYSLLFGNLADVSTYTLSGSRCNLGGSGAYFWNGVPAGDLFVLLVGQDPTGVYESSWGEDGTGAERNGTAPSDMCGATTKDATLTCP